MLDKMFPTNRPYHPILVLISLIFIFMLVMGGVLALVGKWHGVDYFDPELAKNPTIQYVVTQVLAQHVLLFIIPGLLTVFFFPTLRRKGVFSFAKADSSRIGLVLLLFLLGIPIVGFLNWFNMQIPLSENLNQIEDQVIGLLQTLFKEGNPVLMVLLIGLLPAIGEELIFRGVIQRAFGSWIKNPHIAIFIAGVLFGLMHMQFAGMMPRIFLGIVLGYAYYFTGSLLMPMLLHFAFNGTQAVAMVMSPEMIEELGTEDVAEMPDWWVVILATIAFVYVFSLLSKKYAIFRASELDQV